MVRKLRVLYSEAIDHVMNRGDRWEPIFKDDEDRRRLLETLGQVCAQTGSVANGLKRLSFSTIAGTEICPVKMLSVETKLKFWTGLNDPSSAQATPLANRRRCCPPGHRQFMPSVFIRSLKFRENQ